MLVGLLSPGILAPFTLHFGTAIYLAVPVILAAVTVLYFANRVWEGEVGRALLVTSIGLAVSVIMWLPHAVWHTTAQPPWLGVTAVVWNTWFHTLWVITTLFVAYGFYLFWKAGHGEDIVGDQGVLHRTDYGFIASLVVVPVIAAYLAQPYNTATISGMIELGGTVLMALMVIPSLVAIYKTRNLYGGKMGRALELIGIGLLMTMLWVPYILWHFAGIPEPLGPGWLGLSRGWWGGFLHTLLAHAYVVLTYGMYRLWQMEERLEGRAEADASGDDGQEI